ATFGRLRPVHVAGWVAAGASGFGIGGNLYRPGRNPREIRDIAAAFVAAWRAAAPSIRENLDKG
ncbi:hypothetical protein QN226_20565, partial [Sinorhizobium sp. 6-117]|nr:hypothetical protein [Sinorhizobium sp. 6-117]